ncbi:MAG TPA: amidohydrolase family protein, partial [Chitinophagaceae bacterium]|nr:amidohydrolase family protein [Chitinophagaceae bacterium]
MRYIVLLLLVLMAALAQAQDKYILLQPARVFDGENMHEGWWVLVKNNHIEAAGPSQSISIPQGAQRVDLKGLTLLPGFIEGHSHLFLH